MKISSPNCRLLMAKKIYLFWPQFEKKVVIIASVQKSLRYAKT